RRAIVHRSVAHEVQLNATLSPAVNYHQEVADVTPQTVDGVSNHDVSGLQPAIQFLCCRPANERDLGCYGRVIAKDPAPDNAFVLEVSAVVFLGGLHLVFNGEVALE